MSDYLTQLHALDLVKLLTLDQEITETKKLEISYANDIDYSQDRIYSIQLDQQATSNDHQLALLLQEKCDFEEEPEEVREGLPKPKPRHYSNRIKCKSCLDKGNCFQCGALKTIEPFMSEDDRTALARSENEQALDILYNEMTDRCEMRQHFKQEIHYDDQRNCALVLLKSPLFAKLPNELRAMISKFFHWKRVAFWLDDLGESLEIKNIRNIPIETPVPSVSKNFALHLPTSPAHLRSDWTDMDKATLVFTLPTAERAKILLEKSCVDIDTPLRHVIKKLHVLVHQRAAPEMGEVFCFQGKHEDPNEEPPLNHKGWKSLRKFWPAKWEKFSWQEVSIPAAPTPAYWWKIVFYGPSRVREMKIEGVAML